MPGEIPVHSIVGTYELKTGDAERKLADIESKMERLSVEFRTGAISLETYEMGLERLSAEAQQYRGAIQLAAQETSQFAASAGRAATATTAIEAGIGRVGTMSGAASNRIMMIGQTLDDLQYVPQMGLRPIINNIMQIAPAAGIALIALQGLPTIWRELKELAAGTEMEEHFSRVEATVRSVGEALWVVKSGAEEAREAAKEVAESVRSAVPDQATSDRAAAFREAVGQAGGSSALISRIIDAGIGDLPAGVDAATFRAGRERRFDRALSGDADSINMLAPLIERLAPGFGASMQAASPEGREAERARDEAAREDQRKRDEAARENDRREDERKRQREREVASVAGNVRDFAFGSLMNRGANGPERPADVLDHELRSQIKERMLAAGYSLEEAVMLLPAVFKKVSADFESEVRDRVLKGGGSEADATAAMRAERDQQARREAMSAASEADPAVRQRAERFATMAMLSGRGLNGERFTGEIAQRLMQRGLSEDQAGTAARQIAGEAGLAGQQYAGDLRRQMAEMAMQQRRGPETFDAGQLMERVQAGVGNRDIQRDILGVQKNIEQHMRKLVERERQQELTRLS